MSMCGTGSTWGHTHLSAPSRPCPALGALPGCSVEPRRVGSSTPCLPFCQNLSNPSRTFLCGVDVPHVKRREGKMQVWLIFWDLDSNWGRMAKDRGALIGPATNWRQEKHFKSDIFFFFVLAYIVRSDWKRVLFTLCDWKTLKGFEGSSNSTSLKVNLLGCCISASGVRGFQSAVWRCSSRPTLLLSLT